MMAAAQNLNAAKHNLAMLTYKGHINNRDTRKSVEWLRQAEQENYPPSVYMLGVLYMRGEEYSRTKTWRSNCSEVAKLGEVRGQYMAGYIYQAGITDPNDESDSELGYWCAVTDERFEKARSVMINAALNLSDNEESELIKKAEICIESGYEDCLT